MLILATKRVEGRDTTMGTWLVCCAVGKLASCSNGTRSNAVAEISGFFSVLSEGGPFHTPIRELH